MQPSLTEVHAAQRVNLDHLISNKTQVINKLDILINKVKKNYLEIIYFLLLALIAVQLTTVGYSKEGRWDLNEHIASGLNLKQYGSLYHTPNEGFLSIKSPYSPGLAIVISLLPTTNVAILNVIFLILASLTCLAFLTLLPKPITTDLGKVHPDKTFINVITLGIIGTLVVYITYAAEFKLDSLVLIIVIISTLLIAKNRDNKIGINLLVLAISFIGILFKQQFLFSLFINSCIILYNTFYKKQVLNLFLIISVTVALSMLLFRKEFIEYAFIKPSGHPFLVKDGLGFLYECFKVRHVLFLVLFFTLIGYYWNLFQEIKKTGLFLSLNKVENLFLAHASFWFIAQQLSTFKAGGNIGNVETSLLLFIPFAAKQINQEVKTYKNRLLFSLSLLTLVFMATISIIGHGKNQLQTTKSTQVAINNLSQDLGVAKESNLLIEDGLFVHLKKASFSHLNSFDTILSFFLNPKKNHFDFLDYFNKRVEAGPNKIQYLILDSSLKDCESSYSSPMWKNSLASSLFQKMNSRFILTKIYHTDSGEPILYVYKNITTD